MLVFSQFGNAAARWWDGTDTTADADGGAGTWDVSSINWDTTQTGGANTTFGSANSAAFMGNGGIVTINGTFTVQGASTAPGSSAIYAAAVPSAPYTFTGTGTIQLSAAGFIHTNSGTTFDSGLTINGSTFALTFSNGATVDSLVAGSGTFTKGGGGTLKLNNAANTFSGNVTLNQGIITATTLKANGTNSSLGTGSTFVFGFAATDGGTLRYTGTGGSEGSTNRTIQLSTTNVYTSYLEQAGTGEVSYSGGISSTANSAKTLNLKGSTSGTGLISGNIVNGTGSVALSKAGTGTWTLSGTNTYTGGTQVDAGVLITTKAAALASYSTAGKVIFNGGTLGVQVGGSGWTTTQVNTLLTNATKTGGALGIDTTNADLTQWTVFNTTNMGSSLGLTKLGSNKLTLDQTNDYAGATTVTNGTLAVNGSLTATSSVTVQTGATLQGSGAINSSVTIESGGTLAPGNGIESLAIGALTLDAGSTFAYELDKDALAGVAGDLTAVAGNLTLDLTNASLLTLAELGSSGSWTTGEKLTLMSYSGSWNGGLFNYSSSTLLDDSTFSFSGAQWLIDYNDAVAGSNYTGDLVGSSYVTMTVIPEPEVALLGMFGLLFLLRHRR